MKYDACYVCGRALPEGPGAVYHAGLRIRYCRARCADRVRAAERVYDRSSRGRWRRRSETLAILRTQRGTGVPEGA